jgi:hypothetical protein
VCVERRGAIGAHDPEVLEPVVVRHAVDVVEDQRHRATAPELALIADLTPRLLDAVGEEPSLQVAAMVRRVLDEQLGERSWRPVQRRAPHRVLVEVRCADAPQGDVLLDRPMVPACRAKPQFAQRLAVRQRARHRLAQLRLRETDLSGHERMFA